MDEQELLEPINLFQNSLKEKHKEIVERYFDNLTAKSGVDVNANALTCKEYYVVLARIDSSKKKLSGQRGLRIFLVISAILFFLVGTILLTLGIKDALGTFKVWGIIIAILLILSGIAFIVINIVVLNKRIRGIEQNIKDLQQKAKILKSEAEKQMAPLNALFDWNIPSTLATEAAPILQLDKNFPAERFYHLVERFEMKEDKGKNASTIFVQSGTIVDNPFIIERDYVQTMYDHVYTGTLVVSWTTTVSDGKGGRRVVHHTQTLVATITKPAPSYHLDTNTIYANDAAPHLSFTRKIGPGNSVSASELTRFDAAWDKKLAKMQRKEIKSTFTPIGNSKFEGLFQAFDRDNEVEFRVLFTPLGQKNMINLLISKKPYGDDFEFIKKKYINIIHSTHMQTLDYDGNPYHFLGFDHEAMKKTFINYNTNYFQGIFYDFAPILSIPVYQQHKDYAPKSEILKMNNTLHEAEVLANFFDENVFAPENCETHIILKASHVKKCGTNGDIVNITAHGFTTEHHTDLVPKIAGNGRTYMVPVHWIEYIPVEKTTKMVILCVGGSKQDYKDNISSINQVLSTYSPTNDIIYQRGLLAFLLKDECDSFDGKPLNKLFSH